MALVALALLVYIFCSFFALQKPFNLDEGDFASLAHTIGQTGLPILYVAEDFVKDLCNQDLYSVEKHLGYGLWHPPLYGYCLALWFKLFGETTVSGRLMGMFFVLLSLLLCLAIIKAVGRKLEMKKESIFLTCALAAIFFLINPLVLQCSILLDIDSAILTTLMLLFLYAAIRYYGRESLRSEVVLGLIFGLCLLAKITTPLFMVSSLLIFYCLKGQPVKALCVSVRIAGIGVSFFLLTYIPYVKILHLPFKYFLVSIYGLRIKPMVGSSSLFIWPSIQATTAYLLAWISPAFVMLAILGAAYQVIRWFRSKKIPVLILLLVFCSSVLFLYDFLFPRHLMMKYQFIIVPVLIIIIAFFVRRYVENITFKEAFIFIVFGSFFLLFDFFLMPDSIFLFMDILSKKAQISMILYYLLPLLFLPIAPSLILAKTLNTGYVVLGLLTALLSYNLALDFKQTAPYTTTNAWNNYGEAGLKETIAYLDGNLGKDGAIMCRKDVGYYLREMYHRPNLKWYSVDNCLNLAPQQVNDFFLDVLKKDNILFVQIDRASVRVPYLPDSLMTNFFPVQRFGHFIILKKRQ